MRAFVGYKAYALILVIMNIIPSAQESISQDPIVRVIGATQETECAETGTLALNYVVLWVYFHPVAAEEDLEAG